MTLARRAPAILSGLAFGLALSGVARADDLAEKPPEATFGTTLGDVRVRPLLELRTRGEYRYSYPGEAVPDGGQAGAFTRARLGLEATRGPVTARLTLQDTRIMGSPGALAQATASTVPYEAWVGLNGSAARSSFLRFGRQPVTWGEGLLIGEADWSPAARSLDGARARWVLGDFELEALGVVVIPQAPAPGSFGAVRTLDDATGLAGLRSSWAIAPLFRLDATGILRLGMRYEDSLGPARGDRATFSGRISGEDARFSYGLEGAMQLRLDGNETRFAYAGTARVEKTFDRVVLSPGVRLSALYATGDDGKIMAFDPLLPDVHQYGAMDLFAASNVASLAGRLFASPVPELTVAAEYRYARLVRPGTWRTSYLLAGAVAPRGGQDAPLELGHEIDVLCSWSPYASLSFGAGYSFFLAGDGAAAARTASDRFAGDGRRLPAAGDLTHFGYLQASFRL